MLSTRNTEIWVGVLVAAGIVSLFMLAMKVSNISNFNAKDGYELSASFENIGGLKVLSSVSIGGVRVGRVTAIEYNQEAYEAVVKMSIDPRYDRLPKDTSASIFTSGLLGEQYIGLEPGGDEAYLKPGDQIKLTQSAIVMEQVIGQFLFNKASEGASE